MYLQIVVQAPFEAGLPSGDDFSPSTLRGVGSLEDFRRAIEALVMFEFLQLR